MIASLVITNGKERNKVNNSKKINNSKKVYCYQVYHGEKCHSKTVNNGKKVNSKKINNSKKVYCYQVYHGEKCHDKKINNSKLLPKGLHSLQDMLVNVV